jgi:hypothetical protein
VFLKPAGGALTSSTELGNLIEPLSRLQLAGIWPVGDFRFDPNDKATTYILIAVLLAAAVAGLVWAWRRRGWEFLLYVVAAVGGALAISVFASPWVGAKALATGAPAIVLAGIVGAAALAAGGRRVEAALVTIAIVGGVTWSNVLAYHELNLAPRDREAELEQIGDEIAGKGPTLMTDYEPYGVRHFLRKGDAEGASELRRRVIPLRNGRPLDKLEVADVDEFDTNALLVYRTLVLRRSPVASRPPSIYARVRHGRFYDVWQRPVGSEETVLRHLKLGDNQHANGRAPCDQVQRLAADAKEQGGRLAFTRRPLPATVDLFAPPASKWTEAQLPGVVAPNGPATLESDVVLPRTADYEIFVGGSFRGRLSVRVDGKEVASQRNLLSHSGEYEPLGTASLRRGHHAVEIDYDIGALPPGSGGPPFQMGPLFFAPVSQQSVRLLSPDRATQLCGRSLDWIEAAAL